MKKRNLEKFTSTINTPFKDGKAECINVEITDQGWIKSRKGYNTFGEMVDVLWNINKQNKKMGFTAQYTVILPLKGTKPIYSKTINK